MALEVVAEAAVPIPLAARFRAEAGEILALVGPSGSGKSTLLRVIAGLYQPTRGRVVVEGETWLDTERGVCLPPHRRRVGLVPQSYALFPHMSAEGNVVAALGHLPRHERGERARAILDLVHLGGLEARRPAEMSGGQQQRVAVARALAREPLALLLDEPFSAVDRATRERLYREIVDLRRTLDMPVVLVTHDMDEATRLASRMVVLHAGRSLQHGRPLELMTRPASLEVARLVGLRNVFTGRVAGDGDAGVRLDWAGLTLDTGARAPVGEEVGWVVPDGAVVLHRRDRPSRGERENPVPGRVAQVLVLGQTAHVALAPDHAPDLPLHFSLPIHVAVRNGIEEGVAAVVSLLAEEIHLVPPRQEPGAGAS